MEAGVDALPLVVERRTPRWRQAVARPVQNHRDVSRIGSPGNGLEASQPYDPATAVVVASAWLAFYVLAAAHHLLASPH